MKEKRTWLYSFCKVLAPIALKLPYRYKIVKGKNNIPSDGKFILCSNHISILDPFWILMGQKRQVHFMAKEELFKKTFFGWIIRSFGGFAVKRGTADKNAVNKAFDILNEERIMGVFIEGTRSKDGELLPGKAGAAMIAYKEKAPIIPVAIYTKGGNVKFFKRVCVAFGEPITIEQLGIVEGKGKELRDATRNIMNEVANLRQECIDYAESGDRT